MAYERKHFNTEGLDRNLVSAIQALESCFGSVRKQEGMFVEAEFPMTPDGRRAALKVKKLRVAKDIKVICNGWRVRVNVKEFKMKKWTVARIRRLVLNHKQGLQASYEEEFVEEAFPLAAIGILELNPEIKPILHEHLNVKEGYEPDCILKMFYGIVGEENNDE